MNNIYQKLSDARKAIREKNIKKDGTNEFSKYDYFTPESVEKLVSEACEKEKIICICNLEKDQLGYFQSLRVVNLEDTKEELFFMLRTEKPAIKATNDTQQMGGMDTYSERYIKMKVFCIKDNSLDFDAQDNRTSTPQNKKTVADLSEDDDL